MQRRQPTGVRGIMILAEETADRVRSNRLDARCIVARRPLCADFPASAPRRRPSERTAPGWRWLPGQHRPQPLQRRRNLARQLKADPIPGTK